MSFVLISGVRVYPVYCSAKSLNVCISPQASGSALGRLGRLRLARVSPSVGLVGLEDFLPWTHDSVTSSWALDDLAWVLYSITLLHQAFDTI